MLNELWRYYTTPAPQHVRELGFLYEAIAIEARAKRCLDDWTPHLENCKTLIKDGVLDHAQGGHVAIMGSGLLHDVPLEFLSANTAKTELIDIIQMKPAEKRINGYQNLHLVEKDVTEQALPFYYALKEGLHHLPLINTPTWEHQPDLLVSLNLLSQIPLAFAGAAKKHHRQLPAGYLNDMMMAHIELLRSNAKKSLLITDLYQEYITDGRVVDRSEMTTHLNLGEPDVRWLWDICPKGEVYPDKAVVHHVGAWWF